jgi:hypothetical protein
MQLWHLQKLIICLIAYSATSAQLIMLCVLLQLHYASAKQKKGCGGQSLQVNNLIRRHQCKIQTCQIVSRKATVPTSQKNVSVPGRLATTNMHMGGKGRSSLKKCSVSVCVGGGGSCHYRNQVPKTPAHKQPKRTGGPCHSCPPPPMRLHAIGRSRKGDKTIMLCHTGSRAVMHFS